MVIGSSQFLVAWQARRCFPPIFRALGNFRKAGSKSLSAFFLVALACTAWGEEAEAPIECEIVYSPTPSGQSPFPLGERTAIKTSSRSVAPDSMDGFPGDYTAWLFGSRGCPSCVEIEEEILPKLFSRDTVQAPWRVRFIDLDERGGLLFYLKVEESVGGGEGWSLTPVLYYRGKLYRGVRECQRLLAGDKAGRGRIASERRGESELRGDDDGVLRRRVDKITFWIVLLGGLTDGLNPCVFATLVFFMSLLAVSGVAGRRLLVVGVAYCAACFATYTLLGLGVFNVLRALPAHGLLRDILNNGLVLALGILAILSLIDAWRFSHSGAPSAVLIQLPKSLKLRIHALMRRGLGMPSLLVGAFGIGAAVTLIESVCTGQVYVPVLAIMARGGGGESLKWLFYLLIYNVMFTLPLCAVFAVAYFGATTERFIEWSQRNVVLGKLLMGAGFLALAAATWLLA